MHAVSPALDEGPLTLPQTGHRIDRHDAERQRADWLAQVWRTPGTRVLGLAGGRAPLGDAADDGAADDGARLALEPATGELPEGTVYLGEVAAADLALPGSTETAEADGVHVVAVDVADEAAADDPAADDAAGGPARWTDLRRDAAELTAVDAGLLTQAAAVIAWHRSHPCCAACGTATEVRSSGWMRECPQCGVQSFPRTDPAAITAVVDRDDRLLLGSAFRWEADRYSTFAGFVEAGESVEQAVAREVAEEAGVDVVAVHYLGSQAWPFPRSLMLGHLAVVADAGTAAADGEEIRHVRWFTREELAAETASGRIRLPPRSSISRALIEHWHGAGLAEPDPGNGRPAGAARGGDARGQAGRGHDARGRHARGQEGGDG